MTTLVKIEKVTLKTPDVKVTAFDPLENNSNITQAILTDENPSTEFYIYDTQELYVSELGSLL